MNSDSTLNQFIDLARNWSIGYTKIIRTYLAFKRDGNWFLEHSTIIFFTDFSEEITKLSLPQTVETSSLLAVKEVINFEKAHAENILTQESFDPFLAFHNNYEIIVPDKVKSELSCYFEPFTRSAFPGNWRFPALSVSTGASLTQHPLPRHAQLDLELMGHKLPYSGLNDLLDTFGIPHTIMHQGYSSPKATWVITHPAIVLQSSSIDNGIAKIEIRCPKTLDHEQLSLGLRVLTGQPPIARKTISISKVKWATDGIWKVGSVEEHVDDAVAADVHLSYQDQFLGHHWINDPARSLNPRLLLHKLSDSKGVIGSDFFNLKPDFFEDSVSLLLNLLGLTAITYGGIPSLKSAPDILAYSTLGHLFVIECTTTDVGRSGKLLKLSQRVRDIKEAADQGGIGYPHILPVMFTTILREETKACWDEAADFGIALVCRENIQNLIARVETPPTPQEL